jgi:hypothetical protein
MGPFLETALRFGWPLESCRALDPRDSPAPAASDVHQVICRRRPSAVHCPTPVRPSPNPLAPPHDTSPLPHPFTPLFPVPSSPASLSFLHSLSSHSSPHHRSTPTPSINHSSVLHSPSSASRLACPTRFTWGVEEEPCGAQRRTALPRKARREAAPRPLTGRRGCSPRETNVLETNRLKRTH